MNERNLRVLLHIHILPARANSDPHSANQSAEEVLAAAVALVAQVSIVADLAPVAFFATEAG